MNERPHPRHTLPHEAVQLLHALTGEDPDVDHGKADGQACALVGYIVK